MDKYHGVLFDVFTHPVTNSMFGIGESSDKSTLVIEVAAESKAAIIQKTTMVAAICAMGKKLKSGFVRSESSMYFDVVDQVFTHVHPDLYWGGKKWVLASNPPSLVSGIEAVAAAMSTVDSTLISRTEIKAWSTRQSLNAAYMVAFDDLPVWSLVIAQTAMEHGWPVRANPIMKRVPAHLPSTNPGDWDAWLQQLFSEKSIRQARSLLGYDLNNIIKTDQQALIEEGNWSSLI